MYGEIYLLRGLMMGIREKKKKEGWNDLQSYVRYMREASQLWAHNMRIVSLRVMMASRIKQIDHGRKNE